MGNFMNFVLPRLRRFGAAIESEPTYSIEVFIFVFTIVWAIVVNRVLQTNSFTETVLFCVLWAVGVSLLVISKVLRIKFSPTFISKASDVAYTIPTSRRNLNKSNTAVGHSRTVVVKNISNTAETITIVLESPGVEQISKYKDSEKSVLTIDGAWRSGKSIAAKEIIQKLVDQSVVEKAYYHSLFGFGNPTEGIDDLFVQLANVSGISEFKRLSSGLTPDIEQTYGFNGFVSMGVRVNRKWFVAHELFRSLAKIQKIMTARELRIAVLLEDLDRLEALEASKWLRVIETLSFLRGRLILIVTTNRSDLESLLSSTLPNPDKYLSRTLPNDILAGPELSYIVAEIDKVVKKAGADLFKNEAGDGDFVRNAFIWTVSFRIAMEAVLAAKSKNLGRNDQVNSDIDPLFRNQFLRGSVGIVARQYRDFFNSYSTTGQQARNATRPNPSSEKSAIFWDVSRSMPELIRLGLTSELWQIDDWYSAYGFSYVYNVDPQNRNAQSSFEGAEQSRLLAYDNVIKPSVEYLLKEEKLFRNYNYSKFASDLKHLEKILTQIASQPNKREAPQRVGKLAELLTKMRENIFFDV